MSMIYRPRGRAGEYGEFALNLYRGCSHGCAYCYVPSAVFRERVGFHRDILPRQISWDSLQREIAPLAGKELFFCFTCDPYQPLNDFFGITRKAIEICIENNVTAVILTKGGGRSTCDFDLFAANPQRIKYGASLTLLNESDAREWEPGAPLPEERINALRMAHEMGIPTWVSLEPVISPAQTLEIIRRCHHFVDEFKVGKLNYHALTKTIDWRQFRTDVVSLFEKVRAKFYVKRDLATYV